MGINNQKAVELTQSAYRLFCIVLQRTFIIMVILFYIWIVYSNFINSILVYLSSELWNKTDIQWLNLSVAEVFSQVLLGVNNVFVAHTLVPCIPFTPRRPSTGVLITSRVHITSSLRYWMLHQIIRSTLRERSKKNQFISNEDVINSQKHWRKHFCYA